MLSLLRWPCLLQDVLNNLLFKLDRQQWHQRKPSPSFLRFWNWAEEKLSMQPKFVAAQKMLLNETQQTFVNELLSFIALGIYTPLEAR